MFYLKLALTNIKKNRRLYFPYLITSVFTVMMFYSVRFLSESKGLLEDSITAASVMGLGVYVMIIFAVIFLLYISSFLMKNRKKELALYNILGMEKRHVIMIIFIETLIVYLTASFLGLFLGILFSKLMMLLLVKVISLHTSIIFQIDFSSVFYTLMVFGMIYFVSFMINVISICRSNPIVLLKSGQMGEKEPKVKWPIVIIGIGSLGAGYIIANVIKNPISAVIYFFIAVVLVIIGTYALFTAGSIALLKILKKNRKYYYQTKHFISVSQLMYRMKQNAVGLASICILCTCILVMISSTFTLYKGIDETSRKSCQADYDFRIDNIENIPLDEKMNQLRKDMEMALESNHIGFTHILSTKYYSSNVTLNGTVFSITGSNQSTINVHAMTLSDYNQNYHHNETLKENQVLYQSNFHFSHPSMIFNNRQYQMKKVKNEKWLVKDDVANINYHSMTIVFKNDEILKQAFTFEGSFAPNYKNEILVDYRGDSFNEKANTVLHGVTNRFINHIKEEGYTSLGYSNDSRYDNYLDFSQMYGSLLFLGIFLGILFMMAAILIMYYKQLSEGYEDQKRYEILQNVGLSEKEVKQSVSSQVLIFFFLPLIVSVVHMTMAYKIILKMFNLLIINASSLFISCTAVSVIVLVICYALVYLITSRTYYGIVRTSK